MLFYIYFLVLVFCGFRIKYIVLSIEFINWLCMLKGFFILIYFKFFDLLDCFNIEIYINWCLINKNEIFLLFLFY